MIQIHSTSVTNGNSVHQVNVKDLLNMLGRLNSLPDWFKSLVIHTAIFGVFSLTFLYLRVKLNQTPPLFSK